MVDALYTLQRLIVDIHPHFKINLMVKKNHSLPFIVIALAVIMVVIEGCTEFELDIQTVMPLLIAVGVGGAVKKTVENAFAAKDSLPKFVKEQIKTEVEKLSKKTSSAN